MTLGTVMREGGREEEKLSAVEKRAGASVRVPEGRRTAEESPPVTLRQKHLPTANCEELRINSALWDNYTSGWWPPVTLMTELCGITGDSLHWA